jgi:hypothetical protein
MMTILSTLISILGFRIRSRASLELELISLRPQISVLRRQHPGRFGSSPQTGSCGCWPYRVWPQVLDAMVPGQTGNRGPVASPGLPALLALAITPSGTAQDERGNP